MKGLVKTSGGSTGIYEDGKTYDSLYERTFPIRYSCPWYWVRHPHQLLLPKGLL